MLKSFALGSVVGGGAGYMAAPGPKSNKISNALLFGGISGTISAAAAYVFHNNDPTKNPLPRRVFPDDQEIKKQNLIDELPTYDLNLGANSIKAQLKFEKKETYKQDVKNLSKEYKDIFPTPYITVHKIEDQIIKNGKETILMRGCEAIVQTVEEPIEE